MGSLFRLTGDTVTPSAGTRVLKASEAAILLEANAVLDAARGRVADMERKAGEAYERRREEGYRDGVEEGRLEHAEKVMETVLSSVEYIEGIEATLVNVVTAAVRKVIGEIDENERIVRIVRNALVTVRNQQHVTIRVAPADEKAVREGLASMLASAPGGIPACTRADVTRIDAPGLPGRFCPASAGAAYAAAILEQEGAFPA